MDKKLIHNLSEYRQWAWNYYVDNWNHNHNVAEVLGLSPVTECWDSVFDENGEWLHDIDEEGNALPEDTAESVTLKEWVNEVEFPAVVVYWFEKTWSRNVRGDDETYICDFVSLSEFSQEKN